MNFIVSKLALQTGLAQITYFCAYFIVFSYIGGIEFAYLGQYLAYIQIFTILITLREEIRFPYLDQRKKMELEIKIILRSLLAIMLGVCFLIFPLSTNFEIQMEILVLALVGSGVNAILVLGKEKGIDAKDYNLINAIRNNWIYIFSFVSVFAVILGAKFICFLIIFDLISRVLLLVVLIKKLDFFKQSQWSQYSLLFKISPNVDVVTSILSILCYSMPMLLLPHAIDEEIAGKYFLAFRIAMGPVSLLANAFNDYFKSSYHVNPIHDISYRYSKDFAKLMKVSCAINLTLILICYIMLQVTQEQSDLIIMIMILTLPSGLRLSYSSFNFLHQLKNELKGNFYLYCRGSVIIFIATLLAILSDNVLQLTISIAIGYFIFLMDALRFNHRIASNTPNFES